MSAQPPFRPSPPPPPGWVPPDSGDPMARPDGMFGCAAQPVCQEWFEELWVEHGGQRWHPHCAPVAGLPFHIRPRHPITARLMAEAQAERERNTRRFRNQRAATTDSTPFDHLWNYPQPTNYEGGF